MIYTDGDAFSSLVLTLPTYFMGYLGHCSVEQPGRILRGQPVCKLRRDRPDHQGPHGRLPKQGEEPPKDREHLRHEEFCRELSPVQENVW